MRNVNVVHQSLTQSSSCFELNNQLVSFSQFIYYKKPKLFKIIIHKVKFFKTSNLIILMNVFESFLLHFISSTMTTVNYWSHLSSRNQSRWTKRLPYTGLFLPRVIFVLLHMQIVRPVLNFPRCIFVNSDIISEV